ncbi:MAG: Zn-dependent hydrolase [Bacteroidetes bacterium]|nr:Zn-dependent hydrolase [Bacteroidota bacterium]
MKFLILLKYTLFVGSALMLATDAFSQCSPVQGFDAARAMGRYSMVTLRADLNSYSEAEREALNMLIGAAKQADDIFWKQAFGKRDELLSDCKDSFMQGYIRLNYGPWDRLNDDKPFVAEYGAKAPGSGLYPATLTREEFNKLNDPLKNSPYSILQRDEFGNVKVIPYTVAYATEMRLMTEQMFHAANALQGTDPEFSVYLRLRANDLLNGNFDISDRYWLTMKENKFDLIIGPIENYEDKLFGTKTAFEAYVMVRDRDWSQRLEKYIAMLPWLQEQLPADAKYKQEKVGNSNSQLAVFDALYYAGDCNAGSKTIAVNLPNDELIQQELGTRRTQIRNVMQAKFDRMVMPISQVLIHKKQQDHVTFNAFFSNVMFHEVAHGLGVKNTINGEKTVREALGASYSAIEECKADVLGLYMVTQLLEQGTLTEGTLEDYYVTFVSSVFRSVRFGASSAHGKANMITFNHLLERGAITRDGAGTYKVNVKQMRQAVYELAGLLLQIQGDGSKTAADQLLQSKGIIGSGLQGDLSRLEQSGIPVDIYFNQGNNSTGN